MLEDMCMAEVSNGKVLCTKQCKRRAPRGHRCYQQQVGIPLLQTRITMMLMLRWAQGLVF